MDAQQAQLSALAQPEVVSKVEINTFEFRNHQKFITSYDIRNAERLSNENLTFAVKVYLTQPRQLRVLRIIKGLDAEEARMAIQKSFPLIQHPMLNLPIAYYLFTDATNEHRVFEVQYLREKSLVQIDWQPSTANANAAQLLSQAVIALQFLRDVKGIASHSNIKPSNIFFVDGVFLLSDFLLLENLINKNNIQQNQKVFLSPLRRENGTYNREKDDVWALGAVVLQKLISSPSGDRTHAYLEQLASNELIAQLIQQTKIEQNLKDILLSCLQHDEERRPNLNDLSKLLHEAGILDKYQSKNPFENEPEKVFEPIKQIYEQWLASHPELDIEKQGELKSYQFNQKWWVRAVWRDGVPVSAVLQGISLDGKEFMVGQHKNGRLEGQALYVNTEVVYEGEWRQDKYEGYGKLTGRQKGYIYTGGFKNNLFEGEGIYKWANGRELKCVWRNGLKNGLGTIKYKKGRVVEHQWINNRLLPEFTRHVSKEQQVPSKIPFEDRRQQKIEEVMGKVESGELQENEANAIVLQLFELIEEDFEKQFGGAAQDNNAVADHIPNHFYGDLEEESNHGLGNSDDDDEDDDDDDDGKDAEGQDEAEQDLEEKDEDGQGEGTAQERSGRGLHRQKRTGEENYQSDGVLRTGTRGLLEEARATLREEIEEEKQEGGDEENEEQEEGQGDQEEENDADDQARDEEDEEEEEEEEDQDQEQEDEEEDADDQEYISY